MSPAWDSSLTSQVKSGLFDHLKSVKNGTRTCVTGDTEVSRLEAQTIQLYGIAALAAKENRTWRSCRNLENDGLDL